MKSKLLKFLMAALGFAGYTACDGPDMYGCPPVSAPEYGCPYAEYMFDIGVADSENDMPIEGIRVSAIQRIDESYTDTLARGTTSAEGKVRLEFEAFPTNKHELVADDIDGADNGSYDSASVIITTSQDEYTDGEGWYEGSATEEITIKLNKKS